MNDKRRADLPGAPRPGIWCSSNDPKQGSAFTIGSILIDRLHIPPHEALAAAVVAILEAAPNWG